MSRSGTFEGTVLFSPREDGLLYHEAGELQMEGGPVMAATALDGPERARADAELLIELGVDCLQGYLFGAPTLNPPWLDTAGNRARA